MKTKYLKYIILSFFLIAVCSCQKDTTVVRPVTGIEFNFVSDGKVVDTLSFSSLPQTSVVGVSLNNDNLNWTVRSNKTWCTIENGSGRGSGEFGISLDSNESFSPRDTAVLTFSAGEYVDKKTLAIIQLGTDFILSQPLFLSSRNGQSFTGVTVKADTSAKLTVTCPDWLTSTVVKETVSKTIRTTTLKLTTSANDAQARHDRIYFSKDGGKTSNASAYVHQFGNEMKYNASGQMIMPAEKDSTFCFDVPNDVILLEAIDKGHSGKDYVTISATEGSEYTTVYVSFENNLNDCMENRTASNMYITLYNKSRAIIPVIFQPYESCFGINTAKGFLNFAKTVNEGGDISPWQKDGVVHVLTSIDMTSVTKQWPGIGNENHPFTGKFDGGYYPVSSITSSNPLFGVCDGADIQAIKLDESNKFQFGEDPTSETGLSIASVAGYIKNTKIKDCSSSAAVTLGRSVPGENVSIYVAGLVGCADAASSITGCENLGKVTATSELETATNDNLYVGGIAGYSQAPIENCTNSGAIADGAAVYSHYVGGICGDADAVLKNCKTSAAITLSSVRVNPKTQTNDQSRQFFIGGVAGVASADISNCSNSGAITNKSDVKSFEIGGIAGVIDAPLLGLANNINSGNISSTGGVRYLTVGGLYGTVSAEQNFCFAADSQTSLGNISISDLENYSSSCLCIGGYVGVVKNAPITIQNAVWSNTISATFNKADHAIAYQAVGGILGGSYNPTAVGCKPANVVINNCQFNNSAITFTLGSGFTYGARLGTIAGIAGTINGNATITNCITTGTLFIGVGTTSASAKLNSYPSIVSGVVGAIYNGNATIKECTNNAGMRNWTYNNNAFDGTYTFADSGLSIYTANVTAGILGDFLGASNPVGYKIEISNCTNNSYLYSYRGLAGGIAGYVIDATIKNCKNPGSLGSGNRSYLGGIACVANNTDIIDCSAVCPLTGQLAGSACFSAGGIISIAQGKGSIRGCSYFGDITQNGSTIDPRDSWGVVIGNTISGVSGTPSYTISSSKWGGTFKNQVSDPIDITSDNFKTYAVGSSTLSGGGATVSDDCEWWNGQ